MANRGSETTRWWEFHHDWQEGGGEVIEEVTLTIYLNGVEFVSIMGTPLNQDWLAVGFLKNEGIIDSLDEISDLKVTPDGCCIDIWLKKEVQLPEKMVITSGCGSGVARDDLEEERKPFPAQLLTEPGALLEAFTRLQTKDSLYARSRGVHAAGLLDLDSGDLLKVAEDVGRHNTIDKLQGACLIESIPTQGMGLLSTGRISSEMLRKGAAMGCPVIASRTSPTTTAVKLAKEWGITLVGYARHGKLRVYSFPERLGLDSGKEHS
ncbi:MAG TPA: formate dehydrogenase accessory sulfurtransferase FdhD [Chloroflexi bacterium]|nr:MAG: formate dehydrogenase accessory sulfurtransferase FdhD [Chloroflexota bacterium]HDD55559.1 formate dehydrogenase accessory sulfurtransferase FdhD [Chloroflexota bacterium]